MQPASDIVAGRPAAPDHFMVAAAAAEVACPARTAGLLPVHVAHGQPIRLAFTVDAGRQRAHRALLVADETMARGQVAVGGYAEIAGTGAARVRPVGAALKFAHGVHHVGERITLPGTA